MSIIGLLITTFGGLLTKDGWSKLQKKEKDVSNIGQVINLNFPVEFDIAKMMEYMEHIKKNSNSKFREEYSLGYKLFSIANNEIYPFQGSEECPVFVHWDRKQHSYEFTEQSIIIRLPDIDIGPNMLFHSSVVQIPNIVGSRLSFHMDPVFYKHGIAFVQNTWVKSDVKTNTSTDGGSPVPPEMKITYLLQATINWGSSNKYVLGNLGIRGNELKIEGGTLTIGQQDAFDQVKMIRGNVFNGSPRGGYRFPQTGTIIGNAFNDARIDARSLRDNVIIHANRFVSSAGSFTIGPQPEVTFVIEVIETQAMGAVLLLGLKPFIE